jgi:hypothetical protein
VERVDVLRKVLYHFQKNLGLKFSTMEKEVVCVFSKVDAKNPSREFTFSLFIDENDNFAGNFF